MATGSTYFQKDLYTCQSFWDDHEFKEYDFRGKELMEERSGSYAVENGKVLLTYPDGKKMVYVVTGYSDDCLDYLDLRNADPLRLHARGHSQYAARKKTPTPNKSPLERERKRCRKSSAQNQQTELIQDEKQSRPLNQGKRSSQFRDGFLSVHADLSFRARYKGPLYKGSYNCTVKQEADDYG